MNTTTSNDTLLLNKAFGCEMANRRTPTERGGDPNETDVRNLSESNFKEVIVVFTSTPSTVTRGLCVGKISRKKAAATDMVVPPEAIKVEGEKLTMEAAGREGNTVRENVSTMPLYLSEHGT